MIIPQNSWIARVDYSSLCVGGTIARKEIQEILQLFPGIFRYFIWGEDFALFLADGFSLWEGMKFHKTLDLFEVRLDEVLLAVETWMNEIQWKTLEKPIGVKDFWEGFYVSSSFQADFQTDIPLIGIRPVWIPAKGSRSLN